MDNHEPRCLVAHLSWPVVITLRFACGSALTSHIPPTASPPTREKPPKKAVKRFNIAAPLLYALLLVGCGKVDPTLTYLGLKNTAAPSAVEVDIVCDYGGAPCTPEHLRAVGEAVFGQTASRPGSTIRLWWLGNSVGETALIASTTIPSSRGESLRAREAHRAHVVAAGIASFEQASAPLFADFVRRRSPLLESLGKVSLASSGRSHEIWLVTDLLEESLYRFECGALPDEDSFRSTLSTILPADSLRGVTVYAIYAAPNVIDRDRCPVYVERFRAIAALIEAAVGQAGGRFHLSPTSIPTAGAHS